MDMGYGNKGGYARPAGLQAGRRLHDRSGQVAILFALVFTFMFVLFAFVVDFAHLVNSKMNLQIAADMAAYSGASQQARVLNRLGMVNYRLRQNLKELSMRVNVTHLRHNLRFPRGPQFVNGGLDQTSQVEMFVCQQAHGYRALSGLIYDNTTNLCKNASPSGPGLPPIVVPPVIAKLNFASKSVGGAVFARRCERMPSGFC